MTQSRRRSADSSSRVTFIPFLFSRSPHALYLQGPPQHYSPPTLHRPTSAPQDRPHPSGPGQLASGAGAPPPRPATPPTPSPPPGGRGPASTSSSVSGRGTSARRSTDSSR